MLWPFSCTNLQENFCEVNRSATTNDGKQVVSKSCKVVPVMLVGKFVHGKSYPWVEYFEVSEPIRGHALVEWNTFNGMEHLEWNGTLLT